MAILGRRRRRRFVREFWSTWLPLSLIVLVLALILTASKFVG